MDQTKDFNILCYEFQEKIIDVFNEDQNIPFLLKYYLFKEIWKTLKEEKNNIAIRTRIAKSQTTETITKQIELPQDFLNQKEENQDEQNLTN